MAKLNLSAPWVTYYRETEELFRNDPTIRVLFDDEEPELKVMNGRYGPYIVYKKQNVKIPKGKDAENLTLEECREIVADEANISKGGARKRSVKARSTAKKTPKSK